MASCSRPFPALLFGATMTATLLQGQAAIPFESNGLQFKALTRGSVTVMVAPLSTRVRDWEVFQVAITNGSPISWTVKAEDFRFERETGPPISALTAHEVVETLLKKASRTD